MWSSMVSSLRCWSTARSRNRAFLPRPRLSSAGLAEAKYCKYLIHEGKTAVPPESLCVFVYLKRIRFLLQNERNAWRESPGTDRGLKGVWNRLFSWCGTAILILCSSHRSYQLFGSEAGKKCGNCECCFYIQVILFVIDQQDSIAVSAGCP